MPMSRPLKLVIVWNAVFVFLYVFLNWAEYSLINMSNGFILVGSHFPLYIYLYGAKDISFANVIFFNYLLVIFILSIAVNMYFLVKLQRSK